MLRGEAIGQHDAAHPLRSQRIDGDRRAKRGIDAAGKPEDDTGKPILLDVIAQAQHAGGVIGLLPLLDRLDRPLDAAPAIVCAPPMGDRHTLAKRRKLRGERAVGVEHEGGAVEHQLVLAADLVEIDQRQTALRYPRNREVEASLGLVAPIGRTVRHQQDFPAGLRDAFDDVGAPDILADGNADPHAVEHDRARHGSRREHAFLVEHAVVRQIDLEALGLDAAAAEQEIGVVELPLLHPGRADQQRRSVVGGLARQNLDGGTARGLERRLEHEVFGRITADEEFGKHHDVGARARRRGAGLPGFLQAAGHVPYGRIELRQRNREAVGRAGIHGLMYARRRDCANRPARAGPGARAAWVHVR